MTAIKYKSFIILSGVAVVCVSELEQTKFAKIFSCQLLQPPAGPVGNTHAIARTARKGLCKRDCAGGTLVLSVAEGWN